VFLRVKKKSVPSPLGMSLKTRRHEFSETHSLALESMTRRGALMRLISGEMRETMARSLAVATWIVS
jgi:hypothetical protein